MNPQHLSDEAVAAFADGVLGGSARERATRHLNACGECRQAVKIQREAAFALRAAPAPALPSALLDRLRTVPQTTPISTLPTVLTADGTPMLSTFAPMAAFVASAPPHGPHRMRPFVTTAAIVAIAGTLAAGSVAQQYEPAQPGSGQVVRNVTPTVGPHASVINPVNFFRGSQP